VVTIKLAPSVLSGESNFLYFTFAYYRLRMGVIASAALSAHLSPAVSTNRANSSRVSRNCWGVVLSVITLQAARDHDQHLPVERQIPPELRLQSFHQVEKILLVSTSRLRGGNIPTRDCGAEVESWCQVAM